MRSGVSLSLSFVAREKSEQVWLVVEMELRDDAVVQYDAERLSVRVECDCIRVAQRALRGKVIAHQSPLPADDAAAF